MLARPPSCAYWRVTFVQLAVLSGLTVVLWPTYPNTRRGRAGSRLGNCVDLRPGGAVFLAPKEPQPSLKHLQQSILDRVDEPLRRLSGGCGSERTSPKPLWPSQPCSCLTSPRSAWIRDSARNCARLFAGSANVVVSSFRRTSSRTSRRLPNGSAFLTMGSSSLTAAKRAWTRHSPGAGADGA